MIFDHPKSVLPCRMIYGVKSIMGRRQNNLAFSLSGRWSIEDWFYFFVCCVSEKNVMAI